MGIYSPLQPGHIIQVVGNASSATTSGTTLIPNDNTIPQNTEGVQILSQAITPRSTTNELWIEATALVGYSVASVAMAMAIFQDSTANAIAAYAHFQTQSAGDINISLIHKMAAGTVASTTFNIRAGGQTAGTVSLGAGHFGAITHAAIRIMEVVV